MINYFLINTFVFLWVLFLTSKSFKLSYRFKLNLTLFALLSWLVPWELIISLFDIDSINVINKNTYLLTLGNDFSEPLSLSSIQTPLSIQSVFVVLILIGLILFIRDVIKLNVYLADIRKRSKLIKESNGIRYYAVPELQGAHTSGVFRPCIWFSESFVNKTELESVLTHEENHIKSHDQIKTIMISLIRSIFWWNPFVQILAKRSRELIELNCDFQSSRKIGKEKYRNDLAKIILMKSKPNLMLNNISSNKTFDIVRLNQIKKENIMKPSSVTSLIFWSYVFFKLLFVLALALNVNANPALKSGGNVSDISYSLSENQIVLQTEISVFEYKPTEYDERSWVRSKVDSKLIANLGKEVEIRTGSEKMKSINFKATPRLTDSGHILMNMEIEYEVNGEFLKQTPSLMMNRIGEASFVVGSEAEGYKIQANLIILR